MAAVGIVLAGTFLLSARPARGLDGPWIADTFFYWYTWDRAADWGGWTNGVHNTPLQGYYDSRTLADNLHSLRVASEWGMTHHFMDYWAPNWLGEDGRMREWTVMRAAEVLRQEGYDIWMSYYQDGENFEMRDFAKNVSEKRDVYQWLRDFSASPVWPRLQGRPLQLVYARNGAPVPTTDHGAYRDWLLGKYGSLEAIATAWGRPLAGIEEIRVGLGERGQARADAAAFVFLTWRQEWERLDALVREEFGQPGIAASFDVGYGPYRDLGYSGFVRTFCGPHSYGGIFGPPHAEDTERYIQALVAKHFGSVFFDHFKNFYHDWNIRIPGTAYLPDPFHFDRCWTIALMHRAEALLHMSWNEWWEGSNLEPCEEFGKTYCEKNLLYATVMKRCFPNIRDAHLDADVAILLNDDALRRGTPCPGDMNRAIQALRRAGAEPDLLPDVLVTPRTLRRYKAVIAPACGLGFGRNDQGEDVLEHLLAWADAGGALVVSAAPDLAGRLGVEAAEPPAAAGPPQPGADLNVFVDVGTAEDVRFLVSGFSQRENWGRLPEGAFGAGDERTMRWTPGAGTDAVLRLPCAALRDHILRFSGSAVWDNALRVEVGGRAVGAVSVEAGFHEYELAVPAAAIGPYPLTDIRFLYESAHVPGERDPERFPSEQRVCNLALDWIQFSTDNIPPRSREQRFTVPTAVVVFQPGALALPAGQRAAVPLLPVPWLRSGGGAVLSRYGSGQVRDLLLPRGRGRVLYVNGSFADFAAGSEAGEQEVTPVELAYWGAVLTGPGAVALRPVVRGEDLGGERLEAGTTDVVCVYHYAEGERLAELCVPARDVPLAEVQALTADGLSFRSLRADRTPDGASWTARAPVSYYGLFAFAHAPATLTLPALEALPGQTREFPVTVESLVDTPLDLTLRLTSIVPTLSGEPVRIALPARGKATVALPVRVGANADWGRKTVTVDMAWGTGTALFFRPLTVWRWPDLVVTGGLDENGIRTVRVRHRAPRLGAAPTAQGVTLTLGAATLAVGDLDPGAEATVALGPAAEAGAPGLERLRAELSCSAAGMARRRTEELLFPNLPPTAEAEGGEAVAVLAVNRGPEGVGPVVLTAPVPTHWPAVSVLDPGGRRLTCQRTQQGDQVLVPAVLAGGTASRCWLVPGTGEGGMTDLSCRVDGVPGSGSAAVTVSTSAYEVTLSEAAGGTLTRLLSRRSGRDYGRRSLDMHVGVFEAPGHPLPAANTVQFIAEKKQVASRVPARVQVLESGPLRVVVTSECRVKSLSCRTRYEFTAFSDAFRVQRQILPDDGTPPPGEMVVLDTAFRPHALRKVYPGFAGIAAEPPQPHYGWRYSRWIPELMALVNPSARDEAISILVHGTGNVHWVRLGFWPPQRPAPGPLDSARIEFVSRTAGAADVDLTVRLHPGYQLQARRNREALAGVSLVALPGRRPGPVPVPRALPADWWHPAWPLRLRTEVAGPGPERGAVAIALTPAVLGGAAPDLDSVRLVERLDGGLAERPLRVDVATGLVSWTCGGDAPWPRRFDLYVAPGGGPRPPAGVWRTEVRTIERAEVPLDEAGEWVLAGVGRVPGEGAVPGPHLRFASDDPTGGPRVAMCRALLPEPDSLYTVRFRARGEGPEARLACNFYEGPDCDFPQVHTPLAADGAWHEYEIPVRTGSFPATVAPALRFWTMPGRYRVDLARVEIEKTDGKPAAEQDLLRGVLEALAP
ncbi:MAG: hypothetical protein JXR77_12510 [Lentisphaeria bacterium]|nr:hypothetical protein [Lentisphaeria bacterium]